MPPAIALPRPDPAARSVRRRSVALTLTIGVHLLILLLLIRLAPPPPRATDRNETPLVVELTRDPGVTQSRPKAVEKPRQKQREPAASAPPVAPPPRPKPPVTNRPGPPPPLEMIPLSSQEFAAADLRALPSHSAEKAAAGAAAGDASGEDDSSTTGPGQGPNGERLYNAEWYREPSRAELATYMPTSGPPSGWGMIACRTIPQYRVEDCVQLGESPTGSGFSRALRQAAFQFRVRPPRVGGKVMVGTWVRIRVTFTEGTPH